MPNAAIGADNIFQLFALYVLNPLYKLAIAGTFLYFLFGVFMYIANMNNPDEAVKGRNHLLWGLVGLFIVFSVGGLLPLLNGVIGGMFGFEG